jgi:hypothetical protein
VGINLGQYQNYEPSYDDPWAQDFYNVHGYLPWQDPNTGNDSASALINQLNARAFGDSYQSMYGRPPSQEAYNYNWFGARGLGPRQQIPSALIAPTLSPFAGYAPWTPISSGYNK